MSTFEDVNTAIDKLVEMALRMALDRRALLIVTKGCLKALQITETTPQGLGKLIDLLKEVIAKVEVPLP